MDSPSFHLAAVLAEADRRGVRQPSEVVIAAAVLRQRWLEAVEAVGVPLDEATLLRCAPLAGVALDVCARGDAQDARSGSA